MSEISHDDLKKDGKLRVIKTRCLFSERSFPANLTNGNL